jgi:hypothetical protein
MLTGYGPSAMERRLIRRGMIQSAVRAAPSARMNERSPVIDQQLDPDDHDAREAK